MDLLGPDIFSTLWMKGQVLHRERAYLKVPDWSLAWNELLTKKLPTFLSESFWSSLKFLRVTDLTAWLWGWNVRVNGMRSVFSFSAVCSADCRSICWARWWPLERRKQDSHVYRKTSTLPLIFRKNQSRHHINDEVWETVKKVWSSWRGMDAKMNTTSNYVGL